MKATIYVKNKNIYDQISRSKRSSSWRWMSGDRLDAWTPYGPDGFTDETPINLFVDEYNNVTFGRKVNLREAIPWAQWCIMQYSIEKEANHEQ